MLFLLLASCTAWAADRVPSSLEKTDRPDLRNSPGRGLLLGTITLEGKTPVLKPLVPVGAAARDPGVCARNEPIPNESLVVDDKRGGIANVLIWIPSPSPDWKWGPVPKEPAQADIRNCRFSPRMIAVRTGQQLLVRNHDPIVHNYLTRPLRSMPVNVLIPVRQSYRLTMQKSESIPFVVRNSIHPWMKSYVMLTDHPFVDVTDREGKFLIKGLPPGTHHFRVWHELTGFLEKDLIVEIRDDRGARLDLKFNIDRFGFKQP